MSKTFGLFEAYGIEIELMIVRKSDLAVLPISDELMKKVAGEYVSDVECGPITWSNELVAHVIELKTTAPAPTLQGLSHDFHVSVKKINSILEEFDAQLMPSAMHPFMVPERDTKLWKHDNNEIYEAYDRIFGCKGHGWSNLQSMHINLPFSNDEEFRKLHSCIRGLLPLLPGLCASSPIVEGIANGISDNRLLHYQQNQKRVPSIAGSVIPELVKSMDEYHELILSKIYFDITPYDPEGLLKDDWLNSRGAIARFGRKTIEIRVMDSQECPRADLALADFVVTVLTRMTSGDLGPLAVFEDLSTEKLKSIFDLTASRGGAAVIQDRQFLSAFGIDRAKSANEIWQSLFERCGASQEHRKTLSDLLTSGTLAARIEASLAHSKSKEDVTKVYQRLANCLAENELFHP